MLTFREATEVDIPWIVSQEERPDFAAFIHRWRSEEHERNLGDPDKLYLIALDAAGQRAAFVILAGIASQDRNVELVRMAVTHPGTGLGKPLLLAVIDKAFAEVGSRRLWLDVFDDNARALRVYLAAGFREETGCRKPAVKTNGQAGCLIILSILASEYEPSRRGK